MYVYRNDEPLSLIINPNDVIIPLLPSPITLTVVHPDPKEKSEKPISEPQVGGGVGSGKRKVKFQDEEIGELFQGTAVYKRIVPNEEGNDLDAFLKALKKRLGKEISEQVKIHKGLNG